MSALDKYLPTLENRGTSRCATASNTGTIVRRLTLLSRLILLTGLVKIQMQRSPRFLSLSLLAILAVALLCSHSLAPVDAQIAASDSASVLEQLLARPAPTPRTAELTDDAKETPKQRPQQFFAEDKAPPDDAPIEDLLDYWYRWADESARPDPSPTVRQRLWDACREDAERMSLFLPLFPQTEIIAAKVKEIYDRESANPDIENYVREKVKKWLLFNTRYFITDLLVLASKAKDNDKFGLVDNEKELTALAHVEPRSGVTI